MASRRDRLRWWIARQLDRLPGQCWADLHFWASRDNARTTPWSPLSPGCVQDFSREGARWCGKLRDDWPAPTSAPVWPQDHATDVTWHSTPEVPGA